tara:strand:- start:198407 stop:199396 length:990 start_codon:yes stop_codon:yes gene_type:complete
MADSREYIELALKLLKCNQKELAAKLDVSPAQITKWKQGEKMSDEMQRRIVALVDLDPNEIDSTGFPHIKLMTGSEETATLWCAVINYTATLVHNESKDWYVCDDLMKDGYTLARKVLDVVSSVGIDITIKPDGHLYLADVEPIEENLPLINEKYRMLIELDFIRRLLRAYVCVHAWVSTFIEPTLDELGDIYPLGNKVITDVYENLMRVALLKIVYDPNDEYRHILDIAKASAQNLVDYAHVIKRFKRLVASTSLPFLAEYDELLVSSYHTLREDLLHVRDSLPASGHPDIYQNELLRKTRENNAMLRLVCEKLGIREGDVYNQLNSL